jgi:hypothetical protein
MPLTAAQVAELTGKSIRTVQHHARRYGLGVRLGPRVYMFGPDDVLAINLIGERKYPGKPID